MGKLESEIRKMSITFLCLRLGLSKVDCSSESLYLKSGSLGHSERHFASTTLWNVTLEINELKSHFCERALIPFV